MFIEKILSKIFIGYIELVGKTSKFSLKGDVNLGIINNCIIGFWHGESLGMNFFLREIHEKVTRLHIVTTADKRGNYIGAIVENYGAKPLRMPDGVKMKSFLTKLKETANIPNSSISVALDGPLGPFKEPKKLGVMLASEAEKNYVLVKVNCVKKIILNKRWDKYVIPLPFNKFEFIISDMGVINKEVLRNFKDYKETIKEKLQ